MLIEVKAGRHVRDPKTGKLMKEGEPVNVDKSQYWIRRLQAGDVMMVKKTKKPAPKTETKKSEVKK